MVKKQLHHPHYLVISMLTRGTSLLKKKSIENEKLYGMSSQSSRITPGSLQQSLSLISSTTHTSTSSTTHYIQHFPRYPHHYLPCSSPNHQLQQYLPQHPQISSNHPLNHPHNHLFLFYLGFLSQPSANHRAAGEGREHFFSSSSPPQPLRGRLGIGRVVAAGDSPLCMGCNLIRPGNLRFLSASH